MRLLKRLAEKVLMEDLSRLDKHIDKSIELHELELRKLGELIKSLKAENNQLKRENTILETELRAIKQERIFSKRKTKMNEINIKIPLHKLQDLMISHVRYSLPRHTYIVSETIHDVKTYWSVLSSNTREVITRDINEHLKRWESDRNNAFHKLDYDSWEELADWINENRSSASTTGTTARPLVDVLPVVDLKPYKGSKKWNKN